MSHLAPEDLDRVRFTKHARETMTARHITLGDLASALLDPAVTEPHEGRTRYVSRSGVVAVVAEEPDALVVVTFLLRRSATWSNADAVARRTA